MITTGFSKKLIKIFYSAATSSWQIRTFLTPMGVIFFFGLIALFIIAALQLDKFLGFPDLLPGSLNIIVSLPVLVLGLFLVLWSIWHFAKVKGTPVPFNPPSRLVTGGPYAYVRNPMLTGVFAVLFGLGCLFKPSSLTLIFTPFFILLNGLKLKALEEPELERRLGREYLEYKKKTPMFVPRMIK